MATPTPSPRAARPGERSLPEVHGYYSVSGLGFRGSVTGAQGFGLIAVPFRVQALAAR